MIKRSAPLLLSKPVKFSVTGLISSLTVFSVVVAVAQSGNLLKNGSFDRPPGLQFWNGPAKVDGDVDCSGGAYDGNCYAWFQDAEGETIYQDFNSNFSGKYRASVYVKNDLSGGGLTLWRWCGGQLKADDKAFTSSSTWKRVIVESNIQGCNKLRVEVYLPNGISRVDRASLYRLE